jgi:hypothetical protein
MRPYKRLFRESLSDNVAYDDAEQIVNISDLEWGETFQSDWGSAQSKCLYGWRLPSIQELYTAYKKGISGFKPEPYWSATTDSKSGYYALNIHFRYGGLGSSGKPSIHNVRCVREI